VIGVVRFVYLLALALWVGEIVFFSFVVAPAVFRTLGASGAGDVVGAIFPRYYALGGLAAGLAFAAALVLRRASALPGWWTAAAAALALGLAVTAWAGGVVHPRAQQLRVEMRAAGDGSPVHEAFRRAHRAAVALNAAALVAGLVGLACTAVALRE
jgi:hypothetical protein